MSYEILYGKQFVKLDEERVLPIILSGSSNCTMYYGGKEIRERNWYCWCNREEIGGKTADIRKRIEEIVNKNKENNYDGEWFKVSGKWLTSSKILQWFDNAVKSARTIEEIHKLTYKGLSCYIEIAHKSEFRWEHKIKRYCFTTQNILDWIEEAKNFVCPEDYTVQYWSMGFDGIEPLNLGRTVADDIPLICKYGKAYIKDFAENKISYTPNKEEAHIFNNKEEFNKAYETFFKRFKNYDGKSFIAVKAATVNNAPKRNYVIARDIGGYLLKKSSSKAYFTYNKDSAKAFTTEKATQKYIDEKLYNFTGKYVPLFIGD